MFDSIPLASGGQLQNSCIGMCGGSAQHQPAQTKVSVGPKSNPGVLRAVWLWLPVRFTLWDSGVWGCAHMAESIPTKFKSLMLLLSVSSAELSGAAQVRGSVCNTADL